MKWNFADDKPIYAQIVEQIKFFIVSGEMKPGARLESVRELAAQAGVNPNTMQKALAELDRAGLVFTKRTEGRFITEDEQMLKLLKRELAQEIMKEFFEKMRQLGFPREEAKKLLLEGEKGDV